jgi:integrase
LVFPGRGLTRLRNARSFSSAFADIAKGKGFDIRFHDLRASHATVLLDKGVPVHVVAKRIGDDPATLLRWYAKRTKKADTSAANIIGTLTQGIL